MNDLYTVIMALIVDSYKLAAWVIMLCLPVRMLLSGFQGRFDLR